MLLAIDIGNTNVTLGAYDDTALAFTARLATDGRITADQYAIEIKNVLSLHGLEYQNIEDCIIASVVPTVGNAISRAVSMLCDIVPLELGPGIKTGLNIKIDNPAQLGSDMVIGAIAALEQYNGPLALIDMGTATTVSVINEKNEFIGGMIMPGAAIAMNALIDKTAQLPKIAFEPPKKKIGRNTIDCMRSGIMLGAACMLDGMVQRMEEELGQKTTVIATGGMAQFIVPLCKTPMIYEKDLLIKGLAILYRDNKKK